MNLSKNPIWQLTAVCLAVLGAGKVLSQDSTSSVVVPTPNFSNPDSRANTTEVPATGTGLSPVDRTRTLESLAPARPSVSRPRETARNPVDRNRDTTTDRRESPSRTIPATSRQPASTSLSPEEARIEMLEKIGDQLSLRMQMLKQREKALMQRERAIREREETASQRETLLNQLEESLILREEVVRRREKLPPPQAWRGDPAPEVEGRYAAVLDGKTMQFYHAKNAIDPTPVASTQKLMTALIVCEAGNLDEYITIPLEATQVEPTVIGIKTGERYTRRQLLTSLLVKSGNDIAAALAIDNAGSTEAFADRMNEMADRLGLVNSNFKTPHGLPAKGQYSCARDIGIVAFEAYQIPAIRDIVSRKSYNFVFNDGREYLLANTNRVLRSWEFCNGMKTGFTYAAGKCLVSSAACEGEHRIAVIIKSTNDGVWNDSQQLLEWALGLEMLGPLPDRELADNSHG